MILGPSEIIAILLSILAAVMSAVGAVYAMNRRQRLPAQLLDEWQRQGVLIFSDEITAELLDVLRDSDPRRVRSLVKDIQQMMEDHELGPGDAIELAIKPVLATEGATEERQQ